MFNCLLKVVVFYFPLLYIFNGIVVFCEDKNEKTLELSISLLPNEPESTLIFIAKNISNKTIKLADLGVSGNYFIITNPDGKEFVYSFENVRYAEMPVKIEPGENFKWQVPVLSVIRKFKEQGVFKEKIFNNTGVYKIGWIAHRKANRSNDFPVYCEVVVGEATRDPVNADSPPKSTGNEGLHEVQGRDEGK